VIHRGGGRVVRKLVSLRVDGDLPAPGDTLHQDGREIGFVTSSAESPALGPIALGYVHRDFVAPGTSVLVEIARTGARAAAIVSQRPMQAAI
jgi:glycine cleavage system aminomethyltransferase T